MAKTITADIFNDLQSVQQQNKSKILHDAEKYACDIQNTNENL